MEKATYALLLLASVAIPFYRSFENRIAFYKKWPPLLLGILVMMIVYIPWDVIFTQKGVWGFNPDYYLGWRILGLPMEEWLFFIIITYCVIFTFEVLLYFFPRFYSPRVSFWISLLLGLALIAGGIYLSGRAYSMVTMLISGILLLIQVFMGYHRQWLSHFYLTYLVSLVPFLIVNGVLTAKPVVWYNDTENLGIRIFTIPIEDSIYLMGMMLITLMVYEGILKRTYAPKSV